MMIGECHRPILICFGEQERTCCMLLHHFQKLFHLRVGFMRESANVEEHSAMNGRCILNFWKRVPIPWTHIFRGQGGFSIDGPRVICRCGYHDGASVAAGCGVAGSAVSLSLRTCEVARVDGVVWDREVWTAVGTEEGFRRAWIFSSILVSNASSRVWIW